MISEKADFLQLLVVFYAILLIKLFPEKIWKNDDWQIRFMDYLISLI